MFKLKQWFIMLSHWPATVLYQYHYLRVFDYHSDLSHYVSGCTVSVSLRRVLHLSQWFIMLNHWPATVLYQYHYLRVFDYHSDLSRYVSDYTVVLQRKIFINLPISIYMYDHINGQNLTSINKWNIFT
jgi:hypothetical protein